MGEQKGMEVEMQEGTRRSTSKDGSSSVVRWERFLPKMAVRVLLVESDDSTRQIISALLRKCNYKVAAVADGLRAWEVLKERSRDIDLILTEIDLPSISGFALLTLIAEDGLCKNIPVIIMSPHDSIGTVHKCMMRGAADFLMKPIRINELKNLWQHVWRRQSCQSAVGCGLSLQVESAAPLMIDEATAENNAVSDHSSGSKTHLQTEDACFKKGSEAQSSCTNPSLEARNSYAEEESKGLSTTMSLQPPVGEAMDAQDDDGSVKNLCTRANTVAGADEDLCNSKYTDGGKQGHNLFVIGNDLGSQASSERPTTCTESSREAIDLIGAFDNKGAYGGLCSNNGPKIFESSDLNLSWRGFQLPGLESNTNPKNNVLIQSNVSAFSRYTNKQSQLLPIESTVNAVEHMSINVRTNYPETKGGSSTYNRSAASLPMHHREEPEEALPYEQQRKYPIHITIRDDNSSNHFGADCAIFHEQRFICVDEREKQEQQTESMDKRAQFSPATDQSGSDSFCNGPVTRTNWPGSMCASNGNGMETRMSVHPIAAASENGNVDEIFLPLDKRNQREAALMKFRLKRKERCYEKKVRYESRKKLADQRPRVKGQFVRRIPPDPPPTNPEAEYASVGG